MESPSDNLYVSNLPHDITDTVVTALFSPYGVVTQCKVLPNPKAGEPGASGMGVALVRFRSVEEATQVLVSLNGVTPEGFGQPVAIKYKIDNSYRGGGAEGYGKWPAVTGTDMSPYASPAQLAAGAMPEPQPHEKLYFKGLKLGLDEMTFTAELRKLGTVASVKILAPNGNPGMGATGTAMATFASEQDATAVRNALHGQTPEFADQRLLVRYANQGGRQAPAPAWAAPAISMLQDQMNGGAWGGAWAAPPTAGGTAPEPPPHENLYFKGLPGGIDEASLMAVLGNIANITSVKILPNPQGPSGTGTAMALFASVEDAVHCKQSLNGETPDWCGQKLLVRYANQKGAGKGAPPPVQGGWDAPPQAYEAGGAGYGKGGYGASAMDQILHGGPMNQVNADFLVKMVNEAVVLPGAGTKINNAEATIYIGGLPGDTTERHIYKLFSPLGAIFSVFLKHGGDGDKSWAISFVNYVDPLSAQAAIAVYNGMQVPEGNMLKVSIKQQGGKGAGMAAADGASMLTLMPPPQVAQPDFAQPGFDYVAAAAAAAAAAGIDPYAQAVTSPAVADLLKEI